MPVDRKAPAAPAEGPIVDLVAASSLEAAGPAGRWQLPVFLLGFITLGLTLSVIVLFPPKGTVPVDVWMGEVRARLLVDDPFGARERLRWVDRAGWVPTGPEMARDAALLAADVHERVGVSAPMHTEALAAAVASLREASRGMTSARRNRLMRRMLRLRLESGEVGGVLRKEIETFGDPLLEASLAVAEGDLPRSEGAVQRLQGDGEAEVAVRCAVRVLRAEHSGGGAADGELRAAASLWTDLSRRLPASHPGRMRASLERGRLLARLGDGAAALADFEGTLAARAYGAPWYAVERLRVQAALGISEVALGSSDPAQALRALSPYAGGALDRRFFQDLQTAVYFRIGQACWMEGRSRDAAQVWSRLAATPHNVWRHLRELPLAEVVRQVRQAYDALDSTGTEAESLKCVLVALTEGDERSLHALDWVRLVERRAERLASAAEAQTDPVSRSGMGEAARSERLRAAMLATRMLRDGTMTSRRVEAFRLSARLYAAGGALLRAASAWEAAIDLGGERNREYWDTVHSCGACYRDAGLLRQAKGMFDRNVEVGLVPFPEGAGEDLTIQQVVQQSRLESARVRVRLGGEREMEEAAATYRAMLRSPTLGPVTREWRAALAELGLMLVRRAEEEGRTEPLWEGLGYLDEYVQRYGAEESSARLGEIQEARARGLMRAGRWEAASAIWSGLRAERPAIPAPAWALALEADCLLATGRPAQAALLYERAIAREGSDPDGHLHASWFEACRLAGLPLPSAPRPAGAGGAWEALRREILLGAPVAAGP